MSGATKFQRQPHSGSSAHTIGVVHDGSGIQQQLAALCQPLSFVTVGVIIVCVVCVSTEYTAVLMYYMHRLGVEYMLLAARLLAVSSIERRGCSKSILR